MTNIISDNNKNSIFDNFLTFFIINKDIVTHIIHHIKDIPPFRTANTSIRFLEKYDH